MLQCSFFKALRISYFALPLWPTQNHSKGRVESLSCPLQFARASSRQPLLSRAAISFSPGAQPGSFTSLRIPGFSLGRSLHSLPVHLLPLVWLACGSLGLRRKHGDLIAFNSLRHVSPCVAASSHEVFAQADNIGWPRPRFLGQATAKPAGSRPSHPRSTRKAARRTVSANRFISFAAPSGTHLTSFHYLQPHPTAQLKAVLLHLSSKTINKPSKI
jgi:hypothetical protein